MDRESFFILKPPRITSVMWINLQTSMEIPSPWPPYDGISIKGIECDPCNPHSYILITPFHDDDDPMSDCHSRTYNSLDM